MNIPIIDMRNRPSFLHDFFGATPGTPAYETAVFLNKRTGSIEPEHFIRSHTIEGYLQEIREAGIEKAVVVGRQTHAIKIDNKTIHQLVSPHPQLIGIGSIDPQDIKSEDVHEYIQVAVGEYGLRGINIEPGFGAPAYTADSSILNPVYEACNTLNIPIFIMSGPTSPSLSLTNPDSLSKVASRYPDLKIAVYHGFYPYVNEAIGLAFKHPNIHLIPDMYTFLPGGGQYIEGINGFLSDQFLFGTSYPFRAMKQTIDDFLRLGVRENVLERVLHLNARRLLSL